MVPLTEEAAVHLDGVGEHPVHYDTVELPLGVLPQRVDPDVADALPAGHNPPCQPSCNAAKLRRVFAGQVGFMGVGRRGCRPGVAPLAQALPGALETRLASGCQPGAASPLLGAWTPTLSWVNA